MRNKFLTFPSDICSKAKKGKQSIFISALNLIAAKEGTAVHGEQWIYWGGEIIPQNLITLELYLMKGSVKKCPF